MIQVLPEFKSRQTHFWDVWTGAAVNDDHWTGKKSSTNGHDKSDHTPACPEVQKTGDCLLTGWSPDLLAGSFWRPVVEAGE